MNLAGAKTYAAVVGLFGLAVYQASIGQVDQAFQTALGALAAAGIYHGIKQAFDFK
jgi:hypothetical protein